MEVVNPEQDVLLIVAVQLQEFDDLVHPTIMDVGVFSMIEIVNARDARLQSSGGRWHHGQPQVVKHSRMDKHRRGEPLNNSDYAHDTNFGKLKRIPHPELQAFMRKHKAI